MPPLQGVFMNNQGYYYNGGAQGGKDFVVGGKVVAGLNAQVAADFLTVLWVPTTNTLGGATFAVGGALPVGDPMVHVSAVVTGPGGNTISLASSDSAFVVGDPLATAALGWKTGDLHIQLSTIINIPIGDYREGALANLAFHRWAEDGSLAATWHNDKSGWDLSGKAGFTFNGTNTDTDYKTGTEFHIEGSLEKALSPQWSLGAQAYYFHQVTPDSGSGARLGAFEGEVTGVGGTAAYHLKLGKMPATLRLSGFDEFEATNRLQGYSLWLGLSVPLSLKIPTAPPR